MNSQTLDASLEWLVVASRAFAEGLLWGVPWSLLFGAIGFIISIVVVV